MTRSEFEAMLKPWGWEEKRRDCWISSDYKASIEYRRTYTAWMNPDVKDVKDPKVFIPMYGNIGFEGTVFYSLEEAKAKCWQWHVNNMMSYFNLEDE